jgi:hypothetical protein
MIEREILERIAAIEPMCETASGSVECIYCDADSTAGEVHTADCPWQQALDLTRMEDNR